MKKITANTDKKVGLAAMVMILLSFSNAAIAQKLGRYSRSFQPVGNRIYFGVESGVGTSTFKLTSDIKGLAGVKALAEGWNTGLIFGDNVFKLRGSYGKYSYQKSMSESIDQKALSVKITVSPSGLLTKSKYFRLYAITGVDYSTFSFDGVTIPKYVDPNANSADANGAGSACVCTCLTGSLGDPGAPAADEATDQDPSDTVDPKTVNMRKAQINGGLGIEFVGVKGGKFFRMFAESYYGVPFKEIINDLSLNKTSISSQLVINFGVGIGITR